MKKIITSACLFVVCGVALVSAQENAFTRDLSVGASGTDVSTLQS